jgi:hypothetical protein
LLVWSATTDALVADKECGQGFVRDLTFSPDAKFLAYTVGNVVHVLRLTD